MSNRGGMTLIELVVAIAITAAAITSGYQAYASISDRRSVAAAHADSTVHAFAVRQTLTRWLATARLTVEEDEVVFRALDSVSHHGRDNRIGADLVFLTSARSPVSNHGTIVHLFVAHDSGEAGMIAELAEWRGRRAVRLIVDPSIAGMSVECSATGNSSADATPSWVSSTILPMTVRLRFTARGSDTLPSLLRVPLTIRLDAPSSANPAGVS